MRLTVHLRECLSIQDQHFAIVTTDNKQRRSVHVGECSSCEIWAATARHDGGNAAYLRRGGQCRRGTGARSEIAELKSLQLWLRLRPLSGRDQSSGQEWNIEAQLARQEFAFFFFRREQIKQQCRTSCCVESFRNVSVAWAQSAAAAAVSE